MPPKVSRNRSPTGTRPRDPTSYRGRPNKGAEHVDISRHRRVRLITFFAVIALALTACGSGSDAEGDSYAVWETPDGRFVTVITDDAMRQQLEAALAADGRVGIPNGRLQRGDGGFNTGHDWHMVDVELADMAIEVCDGTAAMVDEDVDYWVDTVGQYCPWDARVVAITDSPPAP